MPIHVLVFRCIAAILAVASMYSSSANAQEKAAPAARCTAVHGALLMQVKNAGWESLAADSNVPTDQLLVALFGAEFRSLNGAVGAKVIADVGQRGPFPVLEAAVQFHADPKDDLEVTLERGILLLANMKKTGAANVLLYVAGEAFEIELHDPKTRLAVEVYGRHVPGLPNLTNARQDAPVMNAAFFALEGEVVINTKKHATRLLAPPGNALYLWDNLTRTPDVHRFDTLPDSVKPFNEDERKQFDTISGFAKKWASTPGGIVKAIWQAATSQDETERKAAIVGLGALDEMPRLMQVLSDKDHADARDMAVLAIRHWLGRAPGQSILLHQHLTKNEGYTPTQAKNLLYLFNGIEESKLRQPETYDILIQTLNHAKMPARELARWHLVRLVPNGKSVKYDAAAAEAIRLQAIAEWRRLVPEGKLPSPPKKK